MSKINKKQIGLIGATAIVAGNMMGSGISLLPANLASIGSITIISWFITFVGALALAYVFARLGLIDPKQGGPVAYATKFSPALGFQTGILYWLANWIGNLAIATTGVEYLSVFYQPLTEPLIGGIASIICVWLFTFINFFGADKIAKIVSVTVFLLLIPVLGTAIFGWDKFTSQNFVNNWNVSHASNFHAIFTGIILAIWSFIGVESASVSAGVVKKPNRTIPLATIIGTSIAAITYIASTTAISGMFPAKETAASGAPFALSFGAIVGNWAQPFVSLFTAVACLASLGSWMMLVGQAGIRAAYDGTLPSIFAKVNKRNIPIAGLCINSSLMTVLMIVLMLISYPTHQSTTAIFGYIVSIAVVITIFPYFYSILQLIKADKLWKNKVAQFVTAIIASIFCLTALIGANQVELSGTVVVFLICLFLYAIKNKKRIKRE